MADSDIRNIRKCECQIFDRQSLSCEILRNHEKVDRIMHLVAKLSDFWLFHPGFSSLFYNRFYLSSHLCEADSLSTSEALICILAILNVYGSVSLSICKVPPHLANVLRNVYLRKPIDFVLERICVRILVSRIVIVVMLPHSIIGPHYTVDSSDVMYPLRRN